MKSFSIILKNIRNTLPYFLLVAIYFFFVNLEATKDKNNNRFTVKDSTLPTEKFDNSKRELRIKIPVIPYN